MVRVEPLGAPQHDPWTDFDNVTRQRAAVFRPGHRPRGGADPQPVVIIPNNCDNTHNSVCGVAQATVAAANLPPIPGALGLTIW
jgi:hypothetical protein